MKKRILSILLTLCMVLCLVPTTAFAADCAEDLVDPVIWIHLSSEWYMDGGGFLPAGQGAKGSENHCGHAAYFSLHSG